MQHRALAGAFDMFIGTVEQLKAHRQIVEKAMARWRAPLLMLVFVAWDEYLEEVKESTQRMAEQEALQQIADELAHEEEKRRSEMKGEAEKSLRATEQKAEVLQATALY